MGGTKKKLAATLEYVEGWQSELAAGEASNYGGNELVYAAKRDLGRVRTLLDEGADVNSFGKYKGTPLRAAAEDLIEGNAIAFLLLERGADPTLMDSDGYSPLLFAVDHKNVELVIKLLECGAAPIDDKLLGLKAIEDYAIFFNLLDMWEKGSPEERDAAVSKLRKSVQK